VFRETAMPKMAIEKRYITPNWQRLTRDINSVADSIG
jgi:hypothetical protein